MLSIVSSRRSCSQLIESRKQLKDVKEGTQDDYENKSLSPSPPKLLSKPKSDNESDVVIAENNNETNANRSHSPDSERHRRYMKPLEEDVKRYRLERDMYRGLVDKTLPKIMLMREDLDERTRECKQLREENTRLVSEIQSLSHHEHHYHHQRKRQYRHTGIPVYVQYEYVYTGI